MRHTPEPWRVTPPSGTGAEDSLKTFQGRPYQEHDKIEAGPPGDVKLVAHIYQGSAGLEAGNPEALAEQEATNRRIVACVNALANKDPEALPDLVEAVEAVEALANGQGRKNLIHVAGQARRALDRYGR